MWQVGRVAVADDDDNSAMAPWLLPSSHVISYAAAEPQSELMDLQV